jgi:hypothetical protein
MSYNFSSLNDKEFEKLARDVLNLRFSLDLQDFKSGKDNGIDLRYSTTANRNSIVVLEITRKEPNPTPLW